MDRSAAIKKLEQMRNHFNEEWVDFGGVNEAFELAIEALQEPKVSEDCISRAKAIEAVRSATVWKRSLGRGDILDILYSIT